MLCDRPTHIRLNENNQLHSEGEPAIQFSDGFAVYAHHGASIPARYGTVHPDQWQAQWVPAEKNQSWQQILMHEMGAVRLCQELPTTEVETFQNYVFLKLENVDGLTDRILKQTDTETGAIYAVLVPYHLPSIQAAIRYAHSSFLAETFPCN